MLAEVSAGWAGLKAALDIVKGLNALENAAAVNEVKVTLTNHLLEAQQALFTAQQTEANAAKQIGALEAEIMRLKQWEGERERYELITIHPGAFAYMQKAGMRSGEPAHWLCANCFGNGKKAILQRKEGGVGRERMHDCPSCKITLHLPYNKIPEYTASE